MMKSFSTNSFIAGLMLGALLAGAWFFGGISALEPFAASSQTATSTPDAWQKSDVVSVNEQPAGDTVVVESVTVPPPGVWLAVREVVGGDLGNVLGAARVGGPRTAVEIPLLRATEPGRTYAVQLYRDDGTGPFDPASYSAYVDFDTGARVVAYFTTAE